MIKLQKNIEYDEQLMGHGSISKKLKDYNDDELIELAILALTSKNKILLRCFKDNSLPTLNELISNKIEVEEILINISSSEEHTPEEDEIN